MESSNLKIFEIEAPNSIQQKFIVDFLKKKHISYKTITIKEKTAEQTSYIVTYQYNTDTYALLEEIKEAEEDVKNNLNLILKKEEDNSMETLSIKLLQLEKNAQEIQYKINYHDIINTSFVKQIGDDGLEFIDKEELVKQKSILSYLLKKIGSNIMSGKSIMNISLPVYIFDHRSLLESNLPNFMKGIIDEGNLERIKRVTVYALSNLINSLCMRKPFNPILGETFQAVVDDNIQVYVEQTSHHPPVIGPDFKAFGFSAIEVTTGANSITCNNEGKHYIQLSDGTRYRIHRPDYVVTGVTIGRRAVNYSGVLRVEDQTNGLTALVKFNPDQRSSFKKLFSSRTTFPDTISGNITFSENGNNKDENNSLAKIEGEWSNQILIDSKVFWKQQDSVLGSYKSQKFTLPSDSRFRHDVLLLKHGYEEFSQEAKTFLEEIQRNDRKLRLK